MSLTNEYQNLLSPNKRHSYLQKRKAFHLAKQCTYENLLAHRHEEMPLPKGFIQIKKTLEMEDQIWN